MKIGLLSPSIYMSPQRFPDMIFAPRDLSVVLADGLVGRGHEVYFFTAPDIQTKAHLVAGDKNLITQEYFEEKLKNDQSERSKWASFYNIKRNYEMDLTAQAYQMAKEGGLDIIHSYHDQLAHFFDEMTGFPTVYTLHDPLPAHRSSLLYWLLSRFSKHNYISISDAYRIRDQIGLNFIATVYHGIDKSAYQPHSQHGKYLAFMGRMAPEKGVDIALRVAKITGIPLKIATSSMEENMHQPYFTQVVQPLLAGANVELVGFMSGEAKNRFLSEALAFLFPIHWEEPFGMVMIEAMACGTPVVAYDQGSVAEIVADGKTGFIISVQDDKSESPTKRVIEQKGIEGLVEAVSRVGQIDRAACRKHVEDKFSVEKMVEGYEKVYQKITHNS